MGLSVYPPIVASQRLARHRGIIGDVVLYAVRIVSEESKRLVLRRTSCFYIMTCFEHCLSSLLT
jgi:hypothetical protein